MSLQASGIPSEVIEEIEASLRFNLRDAFRPLTLAAFDGEDDTDDEEEEEEGGDDDEQEEKPADDIKDPKRKDLSEEAKRHRLRAKAEKERADAAEAALKEFTDKDKDAVTKLQGDLEEAVKERDALREQNKTLTIDNAFALSHASKFADPEVALLALKARNKLEIEDGEVEGLDEAVADLLKAKPSLAASGGKDDERDDDDSRREPSGRETNGKKDKKAKADYEALANQFPALRR